MKEKKKPEMVVTRERLISRTENEITTEYTYGKLGSRKEKKMTITYTYVVPKTEEEKEDQQRDIDAAYDVLFEAVLKAEQERAD